MVGMVNVEDLSVIVISTESQHVVPRYVIMNQDLLKVFHALEDVYVAAWSSTDTLNLDVGIGITLVDNCLFGYKFNHLKLLHLLLTIWKENLYFVILIDEEILLYIASAAIKLLSLNVHHFDLDTIAVLDLQENVTRLPLEMFRLVDFDTFLVFHITLYID